MITARVLATLLVAAVGCAALPAPAGEQRATVGARTLFERGEYEAAARLLEGRLQTNPEDREASVLLGWCRYRLGAFEGARSVFERVVEADPAHDDARLGLGYARMQAGDLQGAALALAEVLSRRPADRDALRGVVLTAHRAPDGSALLLEGKRAAQALLDADPGDREALRDWLRLDRRSGGSGERRLREPPGSRGRMHVAARAGRDYLQVRAADGAWSDLFVKGFNLGLGLPGRFPSEFPTDETTYGMLLGRIADLGANTVRVYTLLPPAFYRALARHNATLGARPLRLIQGVWTELPPGHDFDDSGFVAGFRAEIARVVDAVHGNLALAPRPGHASGIYDVDVSAHLLALLIGREWEPFAVVDHNALHPGTADWRGRWLEVDDAPAMERWVARTCEFAVDYEVERYGVLRPVSFANWPTLDPLRHPTESDRAEEDRWRDVHGIDRPERLADAPWEDDRVSLDSTRIRPTIQNKAGFFASYHVYPNYPDFLNLDPGYAAARDREGPNRYAGYLRELKRYHGEQPVLIAEFGISTSRGIAHLQPEGWHHGGHDEREQGELLSRLLRSIHDERCAGGIVFELVDEWFKGTWSTNPLEVPRDRARLWFNAESPEQSYGVLAARPGDGRIRVDGDPADWEGIARLPGYDGDGPGAQAGGWRDLRGLRVAHDEGRVYLLIETGGRATTPHAEGVGLALEIDTIDADAGAYGTSATGVEFRVRLEGPGASSVRVVEGYDPYEAIASGTPLVSLSLLGGQRSLEPPFVPLLMETNRERFGRDGTRYPAQQVDRGTLRYGSLDPDAPGFDTRADVAVGVADGVIELRLPWSLLNVSDPSSRTVLWHDGRGGAPFAAIETEGFRFYLMTYDLGAEQARPLDRLPAEGVIPVPWSWEPWERPGYRLEPKLGVRRIGETMRALPDTFAGGER